MTVSRQPRSIHRPWVQRAAQSVATGLLLAVVGCGGPGTCFVSGKVLVDDRPAEGVYLIFHTKGDRTGRPDSGTARSENDGSFTLVASQPGESMVTAFWPTVTVKGPDVIEGADRLRGAYRDPQHPVSTVTIQEGENVLPPFSLQSPASVKRRARVRR